MRKKQAYQTALSGVELDCASRGPGLTRKKNVWKNYNNKKKKIHRDLLQSGPFFNCPILVSNIKLVAYFFKHTVERDMVGWEKKKKYACICPHSSHPCHRSSGVSGIYSKSAKML